MGKETIGGKIERGKITAITGSKYTVASMDREGVEVPGLTALYRTGFRVGDIVHYVTFDDGTGWITCGAEIVTQPSQRIYYQATAPEVGMLPGDTWIDVDSGNALYEYTSNYEWVLRQFGQGSIQKDSITPVEMLVDNLSAITANMGEITAGQLHSEDYTFTDQSAPYSATGMLIDLSNKIIRMPKTALLADGTLYSTAVDLTGTINAQAGSIGPWVINEKGIGVEKTMLDPEGITSNGVFIGSGLSADYQYPGMSFESAESYVMVSTGGIYGRVKSGSAANSQHVEFYGLPVNDDEYIHSDLSCRSLTFTYRNDGSNPGLKELVHLGANQEGQYLPAAFGTLLLRDGSSNLYSDTIEIDSRGPVIIFNGHSDVGILKNTYNNTVYNLIRNHNNGNISISASGAGLYLGYENTTLIDFFNGALQITSNGIKGNNGQVGYPIITEKTGSSCISNMASATGYVLNVNALWGGSTYSTARVTLSTSDIRLKENIEDSKVHALPLINAIRMREFDWTDGRHQRIGLVADELEQLDDKLVVGGGYTDDGTMDIKSINLLYLCGYLVKAVQELSAELGRLKGEAA